MRVFRSLRGSPIHRTDSASAIEVDFHSTQQRRRDATTKRPWSSVVSPSRAGFVCLFFLCCASVSCLEQKPLGGTALPLVEIFAIEDPLDRARELDRALAGRTLEDLPEVVATADAARNRIDFATGSLLALWWVRQDPRSAYDEGLPHFWLEGPVWAEIVMREWSRTSPDEALDAARRALASEGGPNWQRTLSLAVVRGWFDAPGRALGPLLEFVETLPEGRPKKEALDQLISRAMRSRSLDEAIELVENLPDFDSIGRSALKQDAFSRLATQLAARDPERAIEWAERQSSSFFGEGLFVRIARRWARNDAPAAMAWAESLSEGTSAWESRPRILIAIVRSWNSVDAQAAAAFIVEKPLDETWKPLFQMVVARQAQVGDGEGALARIDAKTRAEGAEYRDELVVAAGRAWRKRDQEAAEAWLAEADLAPDLVQAIRSPGGRSGRNTR